jgi:hypothetical protein
VKSPPKKPVKEMGPAHSSPVKWTVTYEHDDGSTTSHIVRAQTAFLARRDGAIRLGRLASEVTVKLLTEAPLKEQNGKV